MWQVFKIRWEDKAKIPVHGMAFKSESEAFLKAAELGFGYSYGRVIIQ